MRALLPRPVAGEHVSCAVKEESVTLTLLRREFGGHGSGARQSVAIDAAEIGLDVDRL